MLHRWNEENSKKSISPEQLYAVLKARVLNKDYEPEKTYAFESSAQVFGVPVQMLKDCCVRLSREMVIDILSEQTFCVHHFSSQDIVRLSRMRKSIIELCVYRLLTKFKDEERASAARQLEDALAKFMSALEKGSSVQNLWYYNLYFLQVLITSCGIPAIAERFIHCTYLLNAAQSGRWEHCYFECMFPFYQAICAVIEP